MAGIHVVSLEVPARTASARKSAAMLLLTLKEKYRLTQTAINFAVSPIRETMNYVEADVRDAVLTLGILSEEQQASFERVFEHTDPFAGLQSEYLQTKFYKENFNLVVRIYYVTCRLNIYYYMDRSQ